MGNATWGARKITPPEKTEEDHAREIAQAILDRISSPPLTYACERAKWLRQFAPRPSAHLEALLPELEAKAAHCRSYTLHPPTYATLSTWEAMAEGWDRAQAMLDALRQILASRSKG